VRPVFGVVVAALPIALNWSAVTRRHLPEASLPRWFGQALLLSSPQRAVLFVEGDNDTYPLWFLQQVDTLRRDVTVVTVPLLGADWYGDELARRHQLLPLGGRSDSDQGKPLPTIIAEYARAQGRPVVAAVSLDRQTRNQLGRAWRMVGLVYVEQPATEGDTAVGRGGRAIDVDSAITRSWAQRIDAWIGIRRVRPSTDSMDDYAVGLLECPRLSLVPSPSAAQADSLASLCNRR
jgi:hypothetical protein